MVYNNPKNAAHGAILKGMGMVKGVSDLIYLPASQSSPLYALNPSGNVEASPVLFLECKIEGEYQKSEQIEFEKLVRELGHEYYVFRSLGEFQEILKPYL
jgi:hypothetical protein